MYLVRAFLFLLGTLLLFVSMCSAQGYPLVNTTGSTYGTQTPAYAGQGNNHVCWVDGLINTKTANCISGFTTSSQNNGIIQAYVEELAIDPFQGTGSWTWVLPNGLNGTTCAVGTVICELLDAPLVLGTGTDIEGQGLLTSASNYASGSGITFSSSFPSALGQPTMPTVNCNNSGGSLVAGTYYVVLVEANNLQAEVGTPSTVNLEGYTIASAEQHCTFASGSTNSISIASPTVQTSSNSSFNAVDDYLCGSTTMGAEICGSVMNGSMICGANGL